MPDKTGNLQGNKGQFRPGQSGNPAGRKNGSRNRATIAALALLNGDLEAVTAKLVEKAKAGEPWAIKLFMDKLIPNAKDAPVTFPLPDGDLQQTLQAVLGLVSRGQLTISEGEGIAAIVSVLGLAQQVEELGKKVEGLVR
jgi:hypothetical protein